MHLIVKANELWPSRSSNDMVKCVHAVNKKFIPHCIFKRFERFDSQVYSYVETEGGLYAMMRTD